MKFNTNITINVTNPIKANSYAIVETCDREMGSLNFVDTLDEAINKANLLLKIHCAIIGCEDDLTEIENAGLSDYVSLASSKNHNAWCNLKGEEYDVYILPLTIEGVFI